jgi:hypothetical protein
MALWEDVKKNMMDWYGVAADKTNELARVGVRRYDIFGISRDIERQFSEMGSLVYTALNEGRTDLADDPVLLGLMDRVRTLETELKAKEIEIEDIRHQDQAAAAAAAAAGAAAEESGDEPDNLDEDDDIEVEVYETSPLEPVDADAELVDDDAPDARPE